MAYQLFRHILHSKKRNKKIKSHNKKTHTTKIKRLIPAWIQLCSFPPVSTLPKQIWAHGLKWGIPTLWWIGKWTLFTSFWMFRAVKRLRWRAAVTRTASLPWPCPWLTILTSHGWQQEKKQRAPADPSHTLLVSLQLSSPRVFKLTKF